MAAAMAVMPIDVGRPHGHAPNWGPVLVLAATGVAGYYLATKTAAGLEAEAAYYYAEGRVDAHLRSYAIGKLKSLQKAAKDRHDTTLATTIGQWITALGG